MQGGTERHSFRCKHCRHRARVEITIAGFADLLSCGPFTPQSPARRAVDAATSDEILRTLAIARCPSCGRRDRAHVAGRWWSTVAPAVGLSIVFGGALAALLVAAHRVGGADGEIGRLAVIGAVALIAVDALIVIGRRPRWSQLDRRVRWLETHDERTGYRSR